MTETAITEISDFTYNALPGRIVFTTGGAMHRLVEELDRLGAKSVLVVTGARNEDLIRQISRQLLGRVAGVFADVHQHVPADIAAAAVRAAVDASADCIVCIGGGSTTGTAKAIALTLPIPIVAIPTTYAGSEMTPVWGITENDRKTTGYSTNVLPAAVIYDPQLTVGLPPAVTAASGMNAMAHCVEALFLTTTNPITALMAEEGIRALSENLPRAVAEPSNLQARGGALYGAYLAGATFASAGSGLHHAICHVLGGTYGLPHAETHTVMLPYFTVYNQEAAPRAAHRIASALGTDSAGTGLRALMKRLDTPTTLKEIGMRPEDLEQAADIVFQKNLASNPRSVTRAELERLLYDAYSGNL